MANADTSKGKTDVASSAKARSGMVEIKNGKVFFRQKPMSLEKLTETMQETVKFREFLEERMERKESPLSEVPDEYRPLIAKFVHESDKTIAALSKHIQQQLMPEQDDGDENDNPNQGPPILPLETVEVAIKSVARRINYGVDVINSVKIPAALCVWRWEVTQDNHDWLPKASREKIEARMAERIQAKKDLQELFNALPQSEQDTMVGVKASGNTAKAKPQPLHRASSNDVTLTSTAVDVNGTPKASEKKPDAGEGENNSASKGPGRPKKSVDPEKAAREQEKKKKEKEAQDKARSMMANFFSKPKASSSVNSSPAKNSSAPSSPRIISDFDRTFKPFVVKKDVEMASNNPLRTPNKRRRIVEGDVIVIDDNVEDADSDIEMVEPHVDVFNLSPRSHLKHVVSSAQPPGSAKRRRLHSMAGYKTWHPEPVRSIMTRLSEAELTDDIAVVRSLLGQLRDRSKVPAKTFIFHEDSRPGYFGTFTRRSRVIGPRSPFTRDDVGVDYAYDSGEEWAGEEEGGGDDLAEVSDEDRDDDEGSDDMDGWLVDEDEEEVATPIEEREGMDEFPFPPPSEPSKGKRKAEPKEHETSKGGEGAKPKKRKVVVPLVPFTKGPCWESSIGKCEYGPFKAYRVQLLNDTPYPIDPFTFVSMPMDRVKPEPAQVSSSHSAVQFVVPALPAHLSNPNHSSPGGPTLPPSGTAQVAKRPKIMPKSSFPEAHIPYLHQKVAGMNTSSLPVLVDAVYQGLRVHKVKKNAIEAKIREICVKGDRHVWTVKADEIDRFAKTQTA
ncbi:hypothetical protein OF83DRAFT_1176353 [Amylostereum chailletii]|nr:hypothetical protein OF83DRAFT_1176353 [Amylostereum chailletii]